MHHPPQALIPSSFLSGPDHQICFGFRGCRGVGWVLEALVVQTTHRSVNPHVAVPSSATNAATAPPHAGCPRMCRQMYRQSQASGVMSFAIFARSPSQCPMKAASSSGVISARFLS